MGRDQTMHSFVHDWRARHIRWGRAPRADWGDRVGGLKGVACGHSRVADETSALPARATSGGYGPRGGPIGVIVSGA